MFIGLFNLGSLIMLSIVMGLFLGCNSYSIDLVDIRSWDEFVMLRDLMIQWDTYACYLGWAIFIIIMLIVIVNIAYFIYYDKTES